MRYEIFISKDAETDLEQIYDYIFHHDSPNAADHVISRLRDACSSLTAHPDRGSVPKELQAVGISEYRQLLFKPYRVIYRVYERRVVIYVIVDGRRDMQSLLARRLLQR